MILPLKNNHSVHVRLLKAADAENLYIYLNGLSPVTRQRFGPHQFDEATIYHICHYPEKDIHRYVAVDPSSGNFIAYMLFKKGMLEGDQQRYAQRNQFFNPDETLTFAPSVADNWQSSGVGSGMYLLIEDELRSANTRQIVLWGGVQATNEKGVNFYTKHGYRVAGSFWHEGKDNYDMIKWL